MAPDSVVSMKRVVFTFLYSADICSRIAGRTSKAMASGRRIMSSRRSPYISAANSPALSLGGKGVISVLSNVLPRETHEICSKYFEGDIEGSRRLQLDCMGLVSALFSETNPIPVKEALNRMGWDVGECRMPLAPMQPEHRAQLYAELKRHGLIS